MGVLIREFLDVTRMFKRASAPEQSTLFAGQNPIAYNASDPLPLWVIQILVIIGMTQLLALILGRIRQPRVIAEVIGGILLGPSVLGRIPGFLNNIFPTSSMPVLVLTSDIGIILFLFLVGMEVDVRVMRRNARASSTISIAGLVFPLGLGAALAIPLYHNFIDDTVNFGYFVLFVAVAVGITAFPVLCRILTELKLVDTTVGVTVLAAGVGNDIIGWILLALTVALVNASNGITALYILLSAVAYVLFLTLPVRWTYHWLARRTGCIEKGQPDMMMMTLTIVIVLVSAFFTDIIGIHPIFGGFVAGIIIPHQNGYAIALVEKIEDLVAVLFLPIYFTLSGLRTDLGLLDNGITWGYTILICVVSFFSKFLGCSIAARLTGFNLRESGAVGSLMACKGLVELIALNVGLQAGILNTRVFSMFVLHALVTTVMTTPLVLLFYPERVRVRADVSQGGAIGKAEKGSSSGPSGSLFDTVQTTFTMVLDRVEQLPAAMTLAQLLQLPSVDSTQASDPQQAPPSPMTKTAITVDALRLIELTDRASAVLKSHQADMLARSDPVLNVFRTFGQLNHLNVSTSLSVLGQEDYPLRVVQHVRETASQMVIFPWTSTMTGNGISDERSDGAGSSNSSLGPFDSMRRDWTSPAMPTHFMRGVFKESTADVALFIDRHLLEATEGQSIYHIFLPFFGGPDDRLSLSFVVRLCRRPGVTATVLRIKNRNGEPSSRSSTEDSKYNPSSFQIDSLEYGASPDTIYDAGDAESHLQSDTADETMWSHYTSNELALEIRSRIKFTERFSSRPLDAVLESATAATDSRPQSRLLLVAGRSRRLSSGHEVALRHLCAKNGVAVDLEIFKALGHVAAAMIVGQVPASLLVLQASTK